MAIVGAGFTGLWTAYHLSRFAPGMRVVVLEAHTVGHGASGRNGGWCTAEMPRLLGTLIRRHGPMAAMRAYRAAERGLSAIEKVLADEAIDAGFQRDGSLYVARTPPHLARLSAWSESLARLGIRMPLLDRDALRERVDVAGALGAGYLAHCAAINPAALVLGLAAAVGRQGVTVREHTPVTRITAGRVEVAAGTIRAGSVVCATEGYTGGLAGHRRRVVPVQSYVVATAPLPAAAWARTGWRDRVTVTDSRYHFAYLQRTADDRLVIGGRAAGYRYGRAGADRAHARLLRTIDEFFPRLGPVPITHAWSGAFGLHRDAEPSVVYDPATGLGFAGGYGGEGIVLSYLAGRAMAALIAGVDAPEARLCWVGRSPARWEPEPLRFTGIRGVAALARLADGYEQWTGRPARLSGRILERLL